MSADTTTSPPRDPRGAGTGENAVAHRSRKDAGKENDIKERMKEALTEAVKNNKKAADESEDYGTDDAPEELETTEYPEGDPAKGRLDPENLDRPLAIRDRRAYLLDQAQKNQDANDLLNAIQVEQNKKVKDVGAYLSDPDYLREVSMETSIAALKLHDPDVVKKNHEEMQKRMKARQEREAKDRDARTAKQ